MCMDNKFQVRSQRLLSQLPDFPSQFAQEEYFSAADHHGVPAKVLLCNSEAVNGVLILGPSLGFCTASKINPASLVHCVLMPSKRQIKIEQFYIMQQSNNPTKCSPDYRVRALMNGSHRDPATPSQLGLGTHIHTTVTVPVTVVNADSKLETNQLKTK